MTCHKVHVSVRKIGGPKDLGPFKGLGLSYPGRKKLEEFSLIQSLNNFLDPHSSQFKSCVKGPIFLGHPEYILCDDVKLMDMFNAN